MEVPVVKPAIFLGDTRERIRDMPKPVRDSVGQAIFEAQCGRKALEAKPMKLRKGAGVLEVVEDYDTDTYRAVYTVCFAGRVYVLHAFQKKSTQGIRTSSQDLHIIEQRFAAAEQHYRQQQGGGKA